MTAGKLQMLFNDDAVAELSAYQSGYVRLRSLSSQYSYIHFDVEGLLESDGFITYPIGANTPAIGVDAAGTEAFIGGSAQAVYIGNFDYPYRTIYIGTGNDDGGVVIGNGLNNSSLSLNVNTLSINGYTGATGNFYDRNGNQISVEHGLIVGGVS